MQSLKHGIVWTVFFLLLLAIVLPRIQPDTSDDEKCKDRGMQWAKERRLCIVGLAQTCASSLPKLVNQLRVLGAPFQSLHFYILENGSKDDTRQVLEECGGDVTLVPPPEKDKLDATASRSGFSFGRIARMSCLREHLRQWVCAHEPHPSTCILNVDMDLQGWIRPSGLMFALGLSLRHSIQWDALACNGHCLKGIFSGPYDAYAFRTLENKYEKNDWSRHRILQPLRDVYSSIVMTHGIKSAPHGFYRVGSAWNGMVLYSRRAWRRMMYSPPRPQNPIECEHVIAHRDLERIYIARCFKACFLQGVAT